ncbi:hypothetical protein [Bifidobacterium ruminantium]|uniref:hypothetical protein n=1 Tax=Bifidobacterium ruminantium TaxID=78346 RepID=UPI001ED9B470|nr:hypothetical protein [Bifidobacterium ruminantium]
MAGNRQAIDMLHGRIWTKVLRYALPVAATGILEQLFNASGIMIVGNFSQGGGTATVIANIVSSMILLYRLVYTATVIHVNLRELGIDPLTLRQIMRIGLPAGVQSAVFARGQHHHPGRHQQSRHRCHGRVQRRVQHRNHRLLRAQLVQPGLRHLHRAELRR